MPSDLLPGRRLVSGPVPPSGFRTAYAVAATLPAPAVHRPQPTLSSASGRVWRVWRTFARR
jgi:hypothetical protein